MTCNKKNASYHTFVKIHMAKANSTICVNVKILGGSDIFPLLFAKFTQRYCTLFSCLLPNIADFVVNLGQLGRVSTLSWPMTTSTSPISLDPMGSRGSLPRMFRIKHPFQQQEIIKHTPKWHYGVYIIYIIYMIWCVLSQDFCNISCVSKTFI